LVEPSDGGRLAYEAFALGGDRVRAPARRPARSVARAGPAAR
jgi:hypothetical protein